ncbi:hypothetical protein ACFS7Z_06945 [Pontibacter toksunensis]|uniref:Uncharacterized protein n=1 Tax=Pontibacter toksunensis TaxID=1332631 RepID=A0ABW6BRC8_9BACT
MSIRIEVRANAGADEVESAFLFDEVNVCWLLNGRHCCMFSPASEGAS